MKRHPPIGLDDVPDPVLREAMKILEILRLQRHIPVMMTLTSRKRRRALEALWYLGVAWSIVVAPGRVIVGSRKGWSRLKAHIEKQLKPKEYE